jgi:acyl carrier protein
VIFGRESPLDSLGLVALLIDIEEVLASRGVFLTLTNERAMSRSRNPFRSVSSLVAYISGLLDEQGSVA